MNWQNIKNNPPVVGRPIVVRGENKFGLGHSYEVIDFDAGLFDQEEYISNLSILGWVEYKYLEDAESEDA